MRAPRATCEGYLTFRTSPSSPPPMIRRYCFLVGTNFTYYSTQEDAYNMLRLKGEVDVLGVQEWDGKANTHIYTNGFLFATTQSKVFYCYADTAMDKEKWIRAIQMTVETATRHFIPQLLTRRSASTSSVQTSTPTETNRGSYSTGSPSLKPSSEQPHTQSTSALQTLSSLTAFTDASSSINGAITTLVESTAGKVEPQEPVCQCHYCHTSQIGYEDELLVPLAATIAITTSPASVGLAAQPLLATSKCFNCETMFCEKFTSNTIPLPHKNYYYAKRVCDDCLLAQRLVNHVKAMLTRLKAGICVYPRRLDPDTPIELIMPKRPSQTQAANIAINMFKMDQITAEECEQLLSADRRWQLDNSDDHPEIPLDLKILALHREFRDPDFGVYRAVILLHRHLDSDPLLFKPIIEKILHFSFTRIDQVEFYWPQIVHAYLTVPMFDLDKLFWLDELILSVCSRSIHLALLLRWQLQGALEDSLDPLAPPDTQNKYGRVVRLMVEMEREVVGTERTIALKRHPNSRKKKTRLPQLTNEQLEQLEVMTEKIECFRPPLRTQPVDKLYGSSPILTNAVATGSDANSDSDPRFRDYSRFQQHLLTPGTDQDHELERVRLSSIEDQEKAAQFASEAIYTSSLLINKENDTQSSNPTHPAGIFNLKGKSMTHAEKAVLAKHFADECEFVDQITDIAEALRFLPSIVERKQLLPSYLENIHIPPMAYIPLVKATDPFEQIVRIPKNEGTAFSTKARVPIMLIFEVIRGNTLGQDRAMSPQHSPVKLSTTVRSSIVDGVSANSVDISSSSDIEVDEGAEDTNQHIETAELKSVNAVPSSEADYVEDDEVRRLIHRQVSSAVMSPLDASPSLESYRNNDLLPSGSQTPPLEARHHAQNSASIGMPTSPAGPLSTFASIPAPETPIDLNEEIVTPSYAASNHVPQVSRDECSSTIETSKQSGMEVSGSLQRMNLSQEVLDREKDSRKDFEAAFGESWASKRKRLKEVSPFGDLPGWDIVSMLGKSNDDLRQEVFTLQLIQKFIDIFKAAKLPIWLKSYRIIATSSSTGLVETILNAISLDGLKKREGYVSLLHHFEKSYGASKLTEAKQCFIQSMAGYSLVSYFLQIKDRHNGNIMLDNEGHIIHIDYGFLLGIAPGGTFSIETAPFKLTTEMVDVMGGPESQEFEEYVNLCTRGFIACQQHYDEIYDLVDIMSRQSPYPCFTGKDVNYILLKLQSRFKLNLSKEETVAYVLWMIRKSNGNYSTRQYDNFQRMTNGILP